MEINPLTTPSLALTLPLCLCKVQIEEMATAIKRHSRLFRWGRRPSPAVLFTPDLWGYGTFTMAMAIAEGLEGSATRIFAGTGPSFELARRSSFDGRTAVNTMADPLQQELERELSACQAVVSVMNGPVARTVTRTGIPCVFVDCLLWMWAGPPRLPACVPYVQERFPGAQEALDRHRHTLPSAEIVGPLVTRPAARRAAPVRAAARPPAAGRAGVLRRPARVRAEHPDTVVINFDGVEPVDLDPHSRRPLCRAVRRRQDERGAALRGSRPCGLPAVRGRGHGAGGRDGRRSVQLVIPEPFT